MEYGRKILPYTKRASRKLRKQFFDTMKFYSGFLLHLVSYIEAAGCAEFTFTPDSETFAEDRKSILLKWEFHSASTPVYMKWFKTNSQNAAIKNIIIIDNRGKSIATEDKKQPTVCVSYNGSTRIIIDSLQQKGWIACSIDFDSGQTTFSKVFLVFGIRSHSNFISPTQTVIEGSNVTLTCTTTAKPHASITWNNIYASILSLDVSGKIVLSNSSYKKSRGRGERVQTINSLMTNSMMNSDVKGYICSASNRFGQEEANTTVTVHYLPRNTQFRLHNNPVLKVRSTL